MAAPYNPPVKSQDFVTYIGLRSASNGNKFQVNPTIEAGDFKISKDGGALANLATLPVVEPSGSKMVKITISDTEKGADNVTIIASDQTDPEEWADFMLTIPTTSA